MKHRANKLLAVLALSVMPFVATGVQAATQGFTGDYAVSNWTVSAPDGGSVDTSGAPSNIIVIEPDNGVSNAIASFTIAAAGTGIFSFDWAYGGTDCGFASALVYNGSSSTLSTSCTSGAYSQAVAAGDTIGFGIQTNDGIWGSTTLSVSNFSAPELSPVPLPAGISLLGSTLFVLGGMATHRRRRKA